MPILPGRPDWVAFPLVILGWPGVLALAVISYLVPDPEHMVVVLVALGLGIGMASGAGYAAWLRKSGEARIDIAKKEAEARIEISKKEAETRLEIYKREDEVKKASTLAQLEQANEEMKRFKEGVEHIKRKLEIVQTDLDDEREQNERLRTDLRDYAVRVLQSKEFFAPNSKPPNVGDSS
jgi:gas vesicle protein